MSTHNSQTLDGDELETAVAVAAKAAQPSPPALVEESAPVSEQDVATLAYQLWLERGRPQGSSEEDWFEAERELYSRSSRA